MYRYTRYTRQWVLLHGGVIPNTSPVYGARGVSDSAVSPGGRQGSCTAVDSNNGRLLLFGGVQLNRFGELWGYNPSINQFTWIAGAQGSSNYPTYTQGAIGGGLSALGNRQFPSCWFWNNSIVVFAGQTNAGSANDIWKYSFNNDTWVWLKGSSQIGTAAALESVYPVAKGKPTDTALPYPRWAAAYASDVINGRMWMHGGYGWNTAGVNIQMNDLWSDSSRAIDSTCAVTFCHCSPCWLIDEPVSFSSGTTLLQRTCGAWWPVDPLRFLFRPFSMAASVCRALLRSLLVEVVMAWCSTL